MAFSVEGKVSFKEMILDGQLGKKKMIYIMNFKKGAVHSPLIHMNFQGTKNECAYFAFIETAINA